MDRDITLAFLREYPTPERAARLGVDRMGQFLKRHSYRGRVAPDVLVGRLREQLLGSSPGTTAARQWFALAQADQLTLLNRQLDECDRAMATSFQAHPDASLFTSFPGVATVLGATLLAEIGEDRRCFPSPGCCSPRRGSRR